MRARARSACKRICLPQTGASLVFSVSEYLRKLGASAKVSNIVLRSSLLHASLTFMSRTAWGRLCRQWCLKPNANKSWLGGCWGWVMVMVAQIDPTSMSFQFRKTFGRKWSGLKNLLAREYQNRSMFGLRHGLTLGKRRFEKYEWTRMLNEAW